MNGDGPPSSLFTFDGRPVAFTAAEPIATALIRAGVVAVRRTRNGRLRGPFCMIGVCHDCLVEVDGEPNVRACLVRAASGQVVRSQDWSDGHDKQQAP